MLSLVVSTIVFFAAGYFLVDWLALHV